MVAEPRKQQGITPARLGTLLREYHRFRSLAETEGIEEIWVDGVRVNVHDLRRGIDELPDRQRAAVTWCCLYDLDTRVVARMMGIQQPSIVRVYKHRGLAGLAAKYWGWDPGLDGSPDEVLP